MMNRPSQMWSNAGKHTKVRVERQERTEMDLSGRTFTVETQKPKMIISDALHRIDVELPENVAADISFLDCNIATLDGSPKNVYGSFDCSHCNLRSLYKGPEYVEGNFIVYANEIENYNGPNRVGGNINIGGNPIYSLEGIGTYFKDGYCNGYFKIPETINRNILGLLQIPRLTDVRVNFVDDTPQLIKAVNIINHYIPSRDILSCQEELIEAGLKQFAKF